MSDTRTPGEPMRFGRFEVTLIRSQHFPHGMAMGEIREPLIPPARALDYLDGGAFSVLIAHPAGTLLVQGSAQSAQRQGDAADKHRLEAQGSEVALTSRGGGCSCAHCEGPPFWASRGFSCSGTSARVACWLRWRTRIQAAISQRAFGGTWAA